MAKCVVEMAKTVETMEKEHAGACAEDLETARGHTPGRTVKNHKAWIRIHSLKATKTKSHSQKKSDSSVATFLDTRSDDDLMKAFIAGDTAAMEVLFDRHRRAVFGWFLQHAECRSEAEDMYQETWLRVIRSADSYTRGNFRAWLWRIARNLAVDHAKKMKPALTLDSPVSDEDASGTTFIDAVPDATVVHALANMEMSERQSRLRAAVNDLSAALREVVLLRINSELDFAEIAELLHLPLGTVLARMHNAKIKLKETLVKEDR